MAEGLSASEVSEQVEVMNADDHLPPISLFRLFWRMGGWVVIVFGAVFLIVTLIGYLSFQAAERFTREGVPATAVVTEKYLEESRDSDGDTVIDYYLTLKFETQAGRAMRLTEMVSNDEYARAQEGGAFDLLYLRSDPTRVELTQGSNARAANGLQIAALCMGLIWLAGLWWIGRWAVEAGRARAYGARQVAHVTEVRESNVKVNNSYRYRLVWKDAAGHEGTSLLHKATVLDGYGNGDPIVIYQGLKRSWWAGDIGDREGGST